MFTSTWATTKCQQQHMQILCHHWVLRPLQFLRSTNWVHRLSVTPNYSKSTWVIPRSGTLPTLTPLTIFLQRRKRSVLRSRGPRPRRAQNKWRKNMTLRSQIRLSQMIFVPSWGCWPAENVKSCLRQTPWWMRWKGTSVSSAQTSSIGVVWQQVPRPNLMMGKLGWTSNTSVPIVKLWWNCKFFVIFVWFCKFPGQFPQLSPTCHRGRTSVRRKGHRVRVGPSTHWSPHAVTRWRPLGEMTRKITKKLSEYKFVIFMQFFIKFFRVKVSIVSSCTNVSGGISWVYTIIGNDKKCLAINFSVSFGKFKVSYCCVFCRSGGVSGGLP